MGRELGENLFSPAIVVSFCRMLHLEQTLRALIVGALLSLSGLGPLAAAESDQALKARIQGLIPRLETYIAGGMKAFDVPGLASGIVAGDELIYAKGFGVRSKSGGEAVSPVPSSRSRQQAKHSWRRPWRSPSITASCIGTIGSSTLPPTFSSRTHG